MNDDDCVRFLQEALPRLNMRWPGFRRVRSQVCKRLQRRLRELALPDLAAYRQLLGTHSDEWDLLDSFCRISISRFYRDRRIFEDLAQEVLPVLVRPARGTDGPVRVWSAGCASGEEPYTLALLWHFRFPDQNRIPLSITATDLDPVLLTRARTACYPESSLRELPRRWRVEAFTRRNDVSCLRPEFKGSVEFLHQDLRTEAPAGPFHLVACRNLAFTYYTEPLQREVLTRIAAALTPAGFLMIGGRESLPAGQTTIALLSGKRGLYQKLSPDGGRDTS
jgi:chemotaxis protein methyltransferase CheR